MISRTNGILFDIFNVAVVSRWLKCMVCRTSDTLFVSALCCQGSGFIESSPTIETLLDIVRCCRVHSREVGERMTVSVGVQNSQQNLVVEYWSSLSRCDRAWDTTQSPYWIRSTQFPVTSLQCYNGYKQLVDHTSPLNWNQLQQKKGVHPGVSITGSAPPSCRQVKI